MTLADAVRLVERLRTQRKTIVFANGVFDLLHPGHVRYLRHARSLGDALVVGLNSDGSVRENKGPGRPIVPEDERAEIVAALACVDAVVVFDEPTPQTIIEALQPDVLVKGADYKKEQVVGWDFVEANGGRVALAPLISGRSTSAVIQRIIEAYTPE